MLKRVWCVGEGGKEEKSREGARRRGALYQGCLHSRFAHAAAGESTRHGQTHGPWGGGERRPIRPSVQSIHRAREGAADMSTGNGRQGRENASAGGGRGRGYEADVGSWKKWTAECGWKGERGGVCGLGGVEGVRLPA